MAVTTRLSLLLLLVATIAATPHREHQMREHWHSSFFFDPFAVITEELEEIFLWLIEASNTTVFNLTIGAGPGVNATLGAGTGLNATVGAGNDINSTLGAGTGLNATVGAGNDINSTVGAGTGLNATVGPGP